MACRPSAAPASAAARPAPAAALAAGAGPAAAGRLAARRRAAGALPAAAPRALRPPPRPPTRLAAALASLGGRLLLRRSQRFAVGRRSGGGGERPAKVGAGASAAGWFYILLGAAFAASLVATLRQHPLFPFKAYDAAWSFAWLLQTIWDYYATALCLCGIMVATDGWAVGGLWSLGVCLLGSSFSCLWLALKLFRRGTISLRSSPAAE